MSLLPTFFLLGAARSGTTAIYKSLSNHPQIFTPRIKEPNYFAYGDRPVNFQGPGDDRTINAHTTQTRESYLKLYADAPLQQERGDFSPSSLYVPRAAKRIHGLVPEARLIAILRNPIERAFSHYLMLVRDNRATGSFREALKQEPKCIRKGWEHTWHLQSMGFYHSHLQRYVNLFRNDQIRVYIYSDLTQKPDCLIRNICNFIGVDPTLSQPPPKNVNSGGVPLSTFIQNVFLTRNHIFRTVGRTLLPQSWRGTLARYIREKAFYTPSIPPDIRSKLIKTYREDILRLQDLIDRDLSHWLAPPD